MLGFNKFRMVIIFVSLPLCFVTKNSFANFSGKWCWDQDSNISAFSIVINKKNHVYIGGYFSVSQGGNRIDDNDISFRFNETKKSVIQTKFQAGLSGNKGLIEIRMLANQKMKWRILKFPAGDIFVPKEALLHRC